MRSRHGGDQNVKRMPSKGSVKTICLCRSHGGLKVVNGEIGRGRGRFWAGAKAQKPMTAGACPLSSGGRKKSFMRRHSHSSKVPLYSYPMATVFPSYHGIRLDDQLPFCRLPSTISERLFLGSNQRFPPTRPKKKVNCL